MALRWPLDQRKSGKLISYTAGSTKSEGDSFKGETMAVADVNGQYRAVLSSVSPGTYDFTLKGPAHLSRFLGRHTIPTSGEYTINMSDKPLVAGDIAPPAKDDRISIIDYSLMVTHFGPGYPNGGTPADLDFDGDVDIFDYNMIVSNFGKTGDLYAGGPNCPQVTTPAKNPATGECQDFSTPCDVPEGWEKVESCPPNQGFGKAVKMVRNAGYNRSFITGGMFEIDSTFKQWAQIHPQGPMTFEAWLRLDENFSSSVYFLYKLGEFSYPSGLTWAPIYYLQFYGGQLTAFINDTQKQLGGSASVKLNTDEFKVGTWHHIAGVYDGKGIILYFDGKERFRAPVDDSTYPFLNEKALYLQGIPLGGDTLPITIYTRFKYTTAMAF